MLSVHQVYKGCELGMLNSRSSANEFRLSAKSWALMCLDVHNKLRLHAKKLTSSLLLDLSLRLRSHPEALSVCQASFQRCIHCDVIALDATTSHVSSVLPASL